jgi:hypothetical protein
VSEYNERRVLARLGYVEDISNLDDFRARWFCYIAGVIEEEAEKLKG